MAGGSRPYVGGSNHNSILELTFGYNGLGRLDGASNNGNVTGGTGRFSSGSTGLTRLFGTDMGTQISWLLPAALIALGGLVWLTHGRPRTDRLRASVVVWGGWLVATGLVLSFASGIIHPYYTVALAPAIAALVGLGVAALWRHARRRRPAYRRGRRGVELGAARTLDLASRAALAGGPVGAAAVAGLLARRLVGLTALASAVALLLAPARVRGADGHDGAHRRDPVGRAGHRRRRVRRRHRASRWRAGSPAAARTGRRRAAVARRRPRHGTAPNTGTGGRSAAPVGRWSHVVQLGAGQRAQGERRPTTLGGGHDQR